MQRPEPLKKKIKDCNLHDLKTFHAQMKAYIAHLELENIALLETKQNFNEMFYRKEKEFEKAKAKTKTIIYHMARAIKLMGQ